MNKYVILSLIAILFSCSKDVEEDVRLINQKGVAVTGGCIRLSPVTADVYIYVNTDSVMFANMTEDANVAGAQLCRDKLWGNAENILPVFNQENRTFFDNTVTNRATVRFRNLTPGTTYYYRAYATIGKESLYGTVKSFTTPELLLPTSGYVNLGLSVKWAAFNVGATAPGESGGLYLYNDCNHLRLPTPAEWQELAERCVCSVTTFNGKRGLVVTGPSGNSIFLPSEKPVLKNKEPSEGGIMPIVADAGGYGLYFSSDENSAFSFDGYGQYESVGNTSLSSSISYQCTARTVSK